MSDHEEEIDITPEQDRGVLKTIIKEGEGSSQPINGCTVTVHYEGKLPDGKMFDSSKTRGTPFTFELGKGSVIKAWDIGVATMKKGEVAIFTCKPEYGYGNMGFPPNIPPNSTLIFEIEMISWKAEDLSPNKDGGILRTILQVGKGFSKPVDGSTVDLHITGEYNGQIFDDRDVLFPIGEGGEYNICEGIEKALGNFTSKEKSLLEIKSKYAFGSTGKPEFNIPPNADVQYTVTLNNFEKLKEFWLLSSSEKLNQAEFFKNKGTKYFKEGKYSLALKLYQRMENYVSNEIGFDGNENIARKELLKAMRLNVALCYMKLQKDVEARHECELVLKSEPTNEKALFRRGQTYLNTADPEMALHDFEEVVKMNPQNASAIRSISVCKDIIKKQRSQEKKIYANMFEKFAKYDRENENWVYGWWDGNKVHTEKYISELKEEKQKLEATLKKIEKKEVEHEKRNDNNEVNNSKSEF